MLMMKDPAEDLREIVSGGKLEAHFQPIASLRPPQLFGYEGLIRGPVDSALRYPQELFQAARLAGQGIELEMACARVIVAGFASLRLPGRLFLNFSGQCIERLNGRTTAALDFLFEYGLPPNRIVIELTEHERIADPTELRARVRDLRSTGAGFALDDFGDGHSSLRLWAELAPEFVKIDKYFVGGLQGDTARFQCVRALMNLGQVFGTRLVAEGIENEGDLRTIRDLGIEFGQGMLLGQPLREPVREISGEAVDLLAAREIAVYPETVRMPIQRHTVGQLVVPAPTLTPAVNNDTAGQMFDTRPELHAMAVIDGDRPVGIVNRRAFMERYAKPFYRELYGKRSCTLLMNDQPFVIECHASIEELTEMLTGQDQRYLADGVILTESGHYAGLATGESLVRTLAEIRLEAARYANPLTFLPGNIPISAHIARLLDKRVPFTACYSDLNHFKPFNDQYGYWRGDEMIKLAAAALAEHCDPVRDFLGHVGGDDFVVLFQSPDWLERCEKILAHFNGEARALFDPADREAGGIRAEDRQGNPAFFPLTTISIGAVRIGPGDFRRHEDVASAAAAAKREAKHRGLGIYQIERLAAD
jgi:EAL domain-containing protein (putative c-di-GMP-specific phosphodiesterase class I)/GGDEF domain-containing protein